MQLWILLVTLIAMTHAQGTKADTYVGFGVGSAFAADIAAPAAASHPISAVSHRTHDTDSLLAANIGYRSVSGWYAELGFSELGSVYRSSDSSGSDATFTYTSNQKHEEDGNTIETRIGYLFRSDHALAVQIDVGVHRYKHVTTDTEVVLRTNAVNVTERLVNESESIERHTSSVFGIGVSLTPPAPIRLLLRASRYSGVDRTLVTLNAQFDL